VLLCICVFLCVFSVRFLCLYFSLCAQKCFQLNSAKIGLRAAEFKLFLHSEQSRVGRQNRLVFDQSIQFRRRRMMKRCHHLLLQRQLPMWPNRVICNSAKLRSLARQLPSQHLHRLQPESKRKRSQWSNLCPNTVCSHFTTWALRVLLLSLPTS